MKIKRFSEEIDNSQLADSFEYGRKEVQMALKDLLDKYDEFTNDISPKWWRITGHHFSELKKMQVEIEELEPMTEEEYNNEWVRELRSREINSTVESFKYYTKD